jgi:hypothetical protein
MRAILVIFASYIVPSLCAKLGLMLVGLTGLMSLFLLLGSGKPGHFLKTLEQRIAATAGLVGLSYAACDLFWHAYGGLLQSRFLATAFYVGWHVLGGIFLAMLVCILAPRNIKVLLGISVALLLAFSFLVILGYSTGRLLAALMFPSLAIGLLIGMSLHCGILFWVEAPDKAKLIQRSNAQVATGESGAGAPAT